MAGRDADRWPSTCAPTASARCSPRRCTPTARCRPSPRNIWQVRARLFFSLLVRVRCRVVVWLRLSTSERRVCRRVASPEAGAPQVTLNRQVRSFEHGRKSSHTDTQTHRHTHRSNFSPGTGRKLEVERERERGGRRGVLLIEHGNS